MKWFNDLERAIYNLFYYFMKFQYNFDKIKQFVQNGKGSRSISTGQKLSWKNLLLRVLYWIFCHFFLLQFDFSMRKPAESRIVFHFHFAICPNPNNPKMSTAAKRIFSTLRMNGGFFFSDGTRRHINIPTAQHIVRIKRPKRPAFFDEDSTLHYEFAVPEDRDWLLEWELEHAMSPKFVPVPTIGEITRKEAAEFCSLSIARGVNTGCSLLGFDGNELVVMSFNMVITMPGHNYKQLTDADLPLQNLKEDYQEDIDKGPYSSPKLNAIHALLEALEENVHLVFPPNSRVLDLARPTVVHKDYRRKGHGLEAQLLALKMGRDLLNCSHVYSRLAIGETTQMGEKLKKAEPEAAKVFRVIPYEDFRAGGKPVFKDCAGATKAMLFFGDYKNIKNII